MNDVGGGRRRRERERGRQRATTVTAASGARRASPARSAGVEADVRRLALGGVVDLEELALVEAEEAGEEHAGNVWIALLKVSTVSL